MHLCCLRRCQERYALVAFIERERAARVIRATERYVSQIGWGPGYAAHSTLWPMQRGERVQKSVGIGMVRTVIEFPPGGCLDDSTRVHDGYLVGNFQQE